MYATPTGRHFYYNPVTGESRWKPPRKNARKMKRSISGGKVPYLPRSSNSVYAFGCDKELDNHPATSSSDDEDSGMTNAVSSLRSKTMLQHDRFSLVRDSIR